MSVKNILSQIIRENAETDRSDTEAGMGQGIVQFYQNRVKLSWKVAFFSVLILGLFAHIYKFTNLLPNQDSVFNYYDDQNIVTSGRWFLSIACGFSSYYDLSWLIGLLSLVFIGLSAVVVVEFFSISNPVAVILVSGILVVFPNITETFFYEYTADGYMLGILLSIIAAWLAIRRGFWRSTLAVYAFAFLVLFIKRTFLISFFW